MDDRFETSRLLGPAAPELGCDECFALLDEYVELELAARTPTPRSRDCERTSTAAQPAARSTRACALVSGEQAL